MKTIELLNKVVELGFDREKALAYIDASLDDAIGVENRKLLAEEVISDELADDILFGFECEKESNLERVNGGRMEVTKTWKIYGVDGHRQRESFNKSYKYDFSEDADVRIIEVENADRTGTNEYSIIRITRNTPEECEEELNGQLSDGIFENSRVGKVIETENE